ncbi:2OG-Fe(II) oxygenase family protein [Cupriavidus agavae]|nr:hypothetical protein [Cupriavidus agavae]
MSYPPAPPSTPTALFWSGETLRSRRVAQTVLAGRIGIPPLPPRLLADWQREISARMVLEPGDVEVMPLARARVRWPEYRACVEALAAWAATLGLPGLPGLGDVALMVCRGARYHHDGGQYAGAAFCNLFLSEDKGQDVHFPGLDLRVPLAPGTALIFDTCQPHGVIPRTRGHFAPADFPDGRDDTQVFLTWELPIEHPPLAAALGIAFDPASRAPSQEADEGLWLDGSRAEVCPATGAWLR